MFNRMLRCGVNKLSLLMLAHMGLLTVASTQFEASEIPTDSLPTVIF